MQDIQDFIENNKKESVFLFSLETFKGQKRMIKFLSCRDTINGCPAVSYFTWGYVPVEELIKHKNDKFEDMFTNAFETNVGGVYSEFFDVATQQKEINKRLLSFGRPTGPTFLKSSLPAAKLIPTLRDGEYLYVYSYIPGEKKYEVTVSCVGSLVIKATSKEEAISKVFDMSQEEIKKKANVCGFTPTDASAA